MTDQQRGEKNKRRHHMTSLGSLKVSAKEIKHISLPRFKKRKNPKIEITIALGRQPK